MQQLEDDVGAAQREMAGLKAKLSAAKADNVALYEKIRYLQRFGHRPADGGGIVVKVDGDGVPQEAVRNGPGLYSPTPRMISAHLPLRLEFLPR